MLTVLILTLLPSDCTTYTKVIMFVILCHGLARPLQKTGGIHWQATSLYILSISESQWIYIAIYEFNIRNLLIISNLVFMVNNNNDNSYKYLVVYTNNYQYNYNCSY